MSESNNFHDTHYSEMDVQPIEVMQSIMSRHQFQYYLLGNIAKYDIRAGHKSGESFSKDMEKRERYIQWYYASTVLGKYINPKDVGVTVPLAFREDVLNLIHNKITWLKKCKQIVQSGRAEE